MKRPRVARAAVVLAGALAALTACAADPPAAVVTLRAAGCGAVPANGTGSIVAPGRVLTSAHTVAGASAVVVTRGDTAFTATVLGLDPRNDLAVLAIDDRHTEPLGGAPGVDPERGAAASTYVVRDGELTRIDLTIIRPVVIDTTDIYREADVARPGFELAGDIRPGDSGAPVTVDGLIVGVVWARSNVAASRAYAIRADAFAPDPTADLTRCADTG